MAKLKLFLLLVTMCSYFCESYKVLVVFQFPGKSHGILGDGIVKHLLEAGHEVTYLTAYPKKNPPQNLHQVDISDNMKLFPADMINLKAILDKTVDPHNMGNFSDKIIGMTPKTVKNPNVQKLFNDPNQKFDVAIVEWLFGDLVCGYAAVFDCPFIWSSSMEPHHLITRLIDEPTNPAYVPTVSSRGVAPFSFWERVQELKNQLMLDFVKEFIMRDESRIYEEVFGPIVARKGRTLTPLKEYKYQSSLTLGNSHVSLGQATSLPQSYKPIGGYHIDKDVKPLPEDLKKIMDTAKNGVIYFSMGSNLRSKDMPEELKADLLKMLGQLPYTVLWKFEEVLPNLPKNIHILQWAPQQSILAHRNCRLFITHGGLLSTTEAIHFGVPIIGIPVFADQFTNVDRSVSRGFAKKVDLSYDMAGHLKVAIEEILSDPSYKQKVKTLSQIYHDRPVHPGKELVHWVEHVVRTKGALHLRSPALLLPWYQKWFLDLAAVVLVILYVLIRIVKKVISFCYGKKENVLKVKNN